MLLMRCASMAAPSFLLLPISVRKVVSLSSLLKCERCSVVSIRGIKVLAMATGLMDTPVRWSATPDFTRERVMSADHHPLLVYRLRVDLI